MYATLREIYQFDNTIFDTPAIPADLQKDVLITVILDECGDNEVRYSNPEMLKMIIDAFFQTNQYKYTELIKTLNYDYDPLINYDLTITTTRRRADVRKRNTSGKNGTGGENRVSAYDSTLYSPERMSTGWEEYRSGDSEDSSGEETEIRNESGDNSARSTQYMIEEQRRVVEYNIYKKIALEIEDEITIPTWGRECGAWNIR